MMECLAKAVGGPKVLLIGLPVLGGAAVVGVLAAAGMIKPPRFVKVKTVMVSG